MKFSRCLHVNFYFLVFFPFLGLFFMSLISIVRIMNHICVDVDIYI